jgi:predicted RNase H-like nuclease (RuvC/YqgF family)
MAKCDKVALIKELKEVCESRRKEVEALTQSNIALESKLSFAQREIKELRERLIRGGLNG